MTQADRHPPEHVLAELAENGVDDSAEASSAPADVNTSAVRAHVRDCAPCQSILGQLSHVTQQLSVLPAELPIPGHVSERISSALAAEHAGTAESAPSEPLPATVSRLEDRPTAWFRRRVPQVLAAAAAAALLGVIGYPLLTDGGSPVDMATGADDSEDAGNSDELHISERQESAEGAEAREEEDEEAMADEPGDGDVAAQGELSDDPLAQLATEVWESRDEVEPQCGQPLAEELDVTLVGSANVDAEVMVVLTEGDELMGWLVPDCAADVEDGEQTVTVARPVE